VPGQLENTAMAPPTISAAGSCCWVDYTGMMPLRMTVLQARKQVVWQLSGLANNSRQFCHSFCWNNSSASSRNMVGKGVHSPHLPLTPESLIYNQKAWWLTKGQIGLSLLTWPQFQ
jgi:hypothetical protein